MKLEVCAHSIESALNAQNGGADRIELCVELSVGGLTPSYGMIKMAKKLLDIPVYVLIRPRAGDFNYSLLELEIMKEDILFCAEQRVDGVVIGALTEKNEIHEQMTQDLLKTARYMDVTFHRAFDQSGNQFEALDTLKELGIQRILTSGGQGNALDNRDQLEALIDVAAEDLIIMPAGGIRPENIKVIIDTGCQEIHSSCMTQTSVHSELKVVKQMKNLIR